ncbi:MAG: SLC13 family permease [Proteobacteria bacterium]|nr:SLC13 family permease [Pseudomonadota bacterium]MBU4470217.1 SLC13 family permease [Pseudomonadota bacterium]MCG2752633.1 SLC13 family permease [Desulfobacteraceae bacterium]
MDLLTTDMILVLILIGVAVFLFIVEWLRVDVVAILVMVVLPLLHLVTPKEAFVGMSSNAVISIIAVIIIGAGLDKTGLINGLVNPIVKIAGNSPSRIITAISIAIAAISSFMQNVGAAALFLPAIQRVSKSLSIPLGRLLMPIGFAAILGGTCTMVGSSPLILLNDLMAPFNLKPFGLFDVTPIGIGLVISGILCFVLLGKFILPQGKRPDYPEKDISKAAPENGFFQEEIGEAYELSTPEDYTHYRDPITVNDLRRRYLVNVVAIEHPLHLKMISPPEDMIIQSGVNIAAYGRKNDILRMAKEEGMALKEDLLIFKNDLADHTSNTVEAVVAPRSQFEGKTLKLVNLQERFNITPLVIYRQGDLYRAEIENLVLRVGDAILLHGTWKRLKVLQDEGGLLFTTPIDVDTMRPDKAAFAGFWLAVSLCMILIFKIQLSVALMTGALGMIITKVLSIDEAYHSVDWRTIFLLGGLIPLGIATEKTGTAAWVAQTVLGLIGDVQPIVLLSVIGILSTAFTLVISNVGATVLLVPLVVNMAISAHCDPRMAVLVVGIATSNSFILPTHQVNALYMGPGHYRSVDFMKAGGLLSIIFLVVLIAIIYLFYGV